VNTAGSYRCECQDGFYLGLDGRTCSGMSRRVRFGPVLSSVISRHPSRLVLRQPPARLVSAALEHARDQVQLLLFARRGRPNGRMGLAVFEVSVAGQRGVQGTVSARPRDDVQRRRFASFAVRTTFGHVIVSKNAVAFRCVSDINECAQNPAVCPNGACENTVGNYRCICNSGYEADDTGKTCKDIDECDADDTICNGGRCRNTAGSFQVCTRRFSVFGVCLRLSRHCASFQCTCPAGTVLNPQSQACEDVDECDELGVNACASGQCVNTVGSFECECPPGTILDSTGRVCLGNVRNDTAAR